MANAIDFLLYIGQLKQTVRSGWKNYGISNPESVADHMYRMSIMSFLLPSMNINNKIKIDSNKVMKITLVHDLAECIVGDITPYDGYSKAEKLRLETEAMEEIYKTLPNEVGNEIMDLWNEYNSQSTEESKIAKDFDRFDMILQAYEYEKNENKPGFLQDFYDSTKDKFSSELVKNWAEELYKRREQLFLKK